MTTLNADPGPDFPNDVENALTLLRLCLTDLRLQLDPAHDDDLRSMIEENLRLTRFRVATDEQLEVAHRHDAEVEHMFQRAHQAMLNKLANTINKKRIADGDEQPWL